MDWYTEYKKAVWRHVVPKSTPEPDDWSRVRVSVYGSDGYYYSSYTFEDSSMELNVYLDDQSVATVRGPEDIANLIQSFAP